MVLTAFLGGEAQVTADLPGDPVAEPAERRREVAAGEITREPASNWVSPVAALISCWAKGEGFGSRWRALRVSSRGSNRRGTCG